MYTFGVKNDRTCLPRSAPGATYEYFLKKIHQKFRNEALGKVTKFGEHCAIFSLVRIPPAVYLYIF